MTSPATKAIAIKSTKLHDGMKAEAKRRGVSMGAAAVEAFSAWLEWVVEDNGVQAKALDPVWGKDRDANLIIQVPDRALCDDMAEQAKYFGITLIRAAEQALSAWTEWSNLQTRP